MNIDIDTTIEFTTYADITDETVNLPIYTSMYHFFESEKYRGADEEFRKFLLSLSSPDMIDLESRHIGWKDRNPQWHDISERVSLCMIWFILINHFENLVEIINGGQEVTVADEISLLFSDTFQRIQSNNYTTAGIIVSPGINDHVNVISELQALIPSDEIDVLVYAKDLHTIQCVEPYAISNYLPVSRYDETPWTDGYDVIKDSVDYVAILTTEDELVTAQSIATKFISKDINVCIRVC